MTRSAGHPATGALQCVSDRRTATKRGAMARDAVTQAAEQHYDDTGRWNPIEDAPTIHITKTIATLTMGNGDMHPVEAAYLAICRADEEGRFEFTVPHEDGSRGRFVITVEREFTEPTKAV